MNQGELIPVHRCWVSFSYLPYYISPCCHCRTKKCVCDGNNNCDMSSPSPHLARQCGNGGRYAIAIVISHHKCGNWPSELRRSNHVASRVFLLVSLSNIFGFACAETAVSYWPCLARNECYWCTILKPLVFSRLRDRQQTDSLKYYGNLLKYYGNRAGTAKENFLPLSE